MPGSRRRGGSRTIILLGISGSGKDTQARLLRRVLPGSREISTGRVFRAIARRNTIVGRYVRQVIRRGGLMAYWAAAYVWLNEAIERLRGTEDLIFSGAPRRLEEAKMMDDFTADTGRPLPIAVYLKTSPFQARARLVKRGRADDHPRAIAERFRFFERHVRPVIRYYRARRRLITVNGDQPVKAVWRGIKQALRLR